MDSHEAVIVGTGFGGMGAAIQLKRLGIDDLVMLEREDDLGGTWHVNRYPGLAVDIASVTYSYSFEPNPWWKHWYARGAGAEAVRRARRRQVRPAPAHAVQHRGRGRPLGRDAQQWEVQVAGGEPVRARYLVAATGFLSQPRLPDIEGVGDFAGAVVHSAKWDPDVDLAGKRVAIIGTGATAVQLIPELARRPATSRSSSARRSGLPPSWTARCRGAVQRAFARAPFTQRWARKVNTGVLELIMVAGVLHYRRAKALNRGAERVAKRHLRRQVEDPELRRKLTPDYSFGCKRPTFSNDYYRAFTKDHVDLETESIERITPTGVELTDGRRSTSTFWCWPPASTCGTPTSPRSGSSAGTARTSASGGARPGSRPTRASRSPASRTCSTSPRRTPTRGCRSSRPSRPR